MNAKGMGPNLLPIGVALLLGGIVAQKPLADLLHDPQNERSLPLALLSDGLRVIAWLGIIFIVIGLYRNSIKKKEGQSPTQTQQ